MAERRLPIHFGLGDPGLGCVVVGGLGGVVVVVVVHDDDKVVGKIVGLSIGVVFRIVDLKFYEERLLAFVCRESTLPLLN